MVRRSVDPRARVCWFPARTPVARSRLWAIAAHSTQAEFGAETARRDVRQRSVD
ncbi:MAG: hypothetical protein QOI01_5174 [Mycobacterium sp.]|nr:hypothetical protein [Mycobacterium sp.]